MLNSALLSKLSINKLTGTILLCTTILRMEAAGMARSLPKYTYQQLKSAMERQGTVLIDVREPAELKESGVLPGSINIPVGDVEGTFTNTDATQFKNNYGIPKPNKDTEIVVSCRSGRRSDNAQKTLIALGYHNVYNYAGGWLDWEKNTKAL